MKYSATRAENHLEKFGYSVPHTRQLGSSDYNFIRKAASDFGWDWGPSLAPAGLSKGIEILVSSTSSAAAAVLVDIGLSQKRLDNGAVVVSVDAFLRPIADVPQSGGTSSPLCSRETCH